MPVRNPLPGRAALPLLALTAGLAPTAPAHAVTLRVLVSSGEQVTLKTPVQTRAPQTTPDLSAPGLPAAPAPVTFTTWKVGVLGGKKGGNLTLNGQDAGNTTLYLAPTPGSVVEISGRSYRGGVLLRSLDGGVQAINVVDLEDYLRGVVPAEMPASWPAAALQAQAVIARTYAAARVNPAVPYDTCATESCQVYQGVAAEKPGSDAAIQATAGQVIAYGGKAATTYFSSDSGGFTASAKEAWNMDLPYLPAKPDPFSVGPRSRWQLDLPAAKVQELAVKYGAKIGTLRAVTASRVSESGRPSELTLTGSAGTHLIQGAKAGGFIRALGAPSSRVNLGMQGGTLTLQGAGAGHGVGLSQYGALGLANAGYDVLHILGFYYPGTLLSRLAAAPRAATPLLARTPTAAPAVQRPALHAGPALPALPAGPLLARAAPGTAE